MLQSLLFILLLVFIVIAVAAMIVIRIVAKGLGMFRDAAKAAADEFTGARRGNSGRRSGQQAGSGTSSGYSRQKDDAANSRTHTTASGTIIIDNRDPEKADRKIFADDDGEYVDFEESN